MIAHKILQQRDPYPETIARFEKRQRTRADEQSDTRGNSRRIEANPSIAWRMLGLIVCVASGAITAGGLAALIFDGLWVALAASLGGVYGIISYAVCCAGLL